MEKYLTQRENNLTIQQHKCQSFSVYWYQWFMCSACLIPVYLSLHKDNMAMAQEKVACILWLAELKSVTYVQGKCWLEYGASAPRQNLAVTYRCLREIGNVLNKSPGCPRTFNENEVHQTSIRIQSTQVFLKHTNNCTNIYVYMHINCAVASAHQTSRPLYKEDIL